MKTILALFSVSTALFSCGQKSEQVESRTNSASKNNFDEVKSAVESKNWVAADIAFNKYLGYIIPYANKADKYCPSLKAINTLYVKNSEGLYGLSVQKEIQEKSADIFEFAKNVGWTEISSWDEWVSILNNDAESNKKTKVKGFYPVTPSLFDKEEFILASSDGMFGQITGWLFRDDNYAVDARKRAGFYLNRSLKRCDW
jgi:hypothetical protein